MFFVMAKKLGQNVPKKSKTLVNVEPTKIYNSGKGGKRNGAGRPQKGAGSGGSTRLEIPVRGLRSLAS
jgi:hypothetical protein